MCGQLNVLAHYSTVTASHTVDLPVSTCVLPRCHDSGCRLNLVTCMCCSITSVQVKMLLHIKCCVPGYIPGTNTLVLLSLVMCISAH